MPYLCEQRPDDKNDYLYGSGAIGNVWICDASHSRAESGENHRAQEAVFYFS